MQQYILIPELACIVRKDADDGRHVAYHGMKLPSASRNYRELLSGSITERNLYWDVPERNGYPLITCTKEST